MADEDKAQKQPKDSPKAQVTPVPVVPSSPQGAVTTVDSTQLRCPHCDRLSEWSNTFLTVNRGKRAVCPNCGTTFALP